MANILTSMAPDIYHSMDTVVRNAVGFIPSVTLNAGAETAAYNDTVRSFATRQPTTVTSYAPSMTIPEGTDQTVDTLTMTLDQYVRQDIPLSGEDYKHLDNGFGANAVIRDWMTQAIAKAVDTIEAHVASVAALGASRAFGTAGTTPFASNFNEVANLRQIMVDNGLPMDGRNSVVFNTTAGTAMRNLSTLYKVNEAGTEEMLRQGTLMNLHGFMFKESAQITNFTKGTGTSYTTTAAGFAVGTTSIPIIIGSGTVLAGDVVTFAGDTNKYVVATGVAAPGTIVLQAPGLRQAIPASATAMTIGGTYAPNVALWQGAVELAVRPPNKPLGGDAATETMVIQDPRSGLAFTFSFYKGFNKNLIMLEAFYKAKVWKPQGVALLLG
jgi:hypothetical protein